MSTYSNWLQPALQNLLQRVVRFFHPRSSCMMHISAGVFNGWKSLVKPVMRQKACNYIELFGSSTRDHHAQRRYIGGRSENNIKCVVHDDLGWKNQTTRYILPHHWLYEWFSQFHSCGTYSVLSRSPSIVAFQRRTLPHYKGLPTCTVKPLMHRSNFNRMPFPTPPMTHAELNPGSLG